MKNSIRRSVVVLSVSTFLLATVSGCSQSTKTLSNETEKTKKMEATLKCIFPLDAPKGQEEVIEAVEEKLAKDGLNFKLQFTYIPFDAYWNKLALIAACGEDYDLTWTHVNNIANFVSKKAMAPLNEALENYGQEILKNTPKSALEEVTIDGKIYGIPRVMPMAENGSFVQIRGDLRKKYNIPEITTIEGMDKYFEAIAKNEPTMTPYLSDPGRFLKREYNGDVAFFAGEFFDAPVYIDPADKTTTVKNTYSSTFFRDILCKMREWQSKGYISIDASAIIEASSITDAEGALNAGKLAATQSFVLKQTERIDNFKTAMPDGELENVYLHPEKPKYKLSADDNLLSVFSTSKHVNEAVAFVNWIRSNQENYDLFTYGIKDLNYKIIGNSISYTGITSVHNYQPVSWSWNDIKYYRFSNFISDDYATTLRNWDKDSVVSPTLGFVPNLQPVKSEIAQLKAVIGEYKPILYNCNVDWDTTMDKFQKKLKDAGIDNVIAEIQKQFNEFKSKK